MVMNYSADYQDSAPTTLLWTGVNFANQTATSKDPKIDYTLSTGYGNAVMGVASGNISAVTGVATANISKVNGV